MLRSIHITAGLFICVVFGCLTMGTSALAQSPQPKAGDPLPFLNSDQLERFFLGKEQFLRTFSEAEGLGPGFNQDS